jgi:hypothetical protein
MTDLAGHLSETDFESEARATSRNAFHRKDTLSYNSVGGFFMQGVEREKGAAGKMLALGIEAYDQASTPDLLKSSF